MYKIYVTCSALEAGGAERVLSILSKPFATHYCEVEYLTWQDRPNFYQIDDRVKITSIERSSKSKNLLKKIKWFRKYVKKNKPDIIISFSAPFNMLTIASLLLCKVKIIACERTDPRSFRWGKLLELLRNALYLKTIGILTQTMISKSYFKGSLLSKTDIIYNPISMCPEEVGSALKQKKENIIVTAARLAKEKRHDLLIRGFKKFKLDHPDYKLIIYGDGNERSILESLIEELGLEDSVYLPGKVNDLWNRIKKAKAFIMTSKVEGMSNSMIEAMTLGIPTISTRVSGAIDLIKDGNNGILIDSTIDDIYNSLCKICDNEKFATNIGRNGSKIYDSLNVHKISNEWISYIDSKISS